MGEPEHVRMKSIKTESKILTVADIAAHAQKYRADGLVVTNRHVILDARVVRVRLGCMGGPP